MKQNSKIFIAGHRGMVGAAIVRKLCKDGFTNIISRSFRELDLRNQPLAADFLYDNLLIESNIIHASYLWNVKKLLFSGSSCVNSI